MKRKPTFVLSLLITGLIVFLTVPSISYCLGEPFVSKKAGYQIQPPTDWQIRKNPGQDVDVLFYKNTEKFRVNITVMSARVDNPSIDSFFKEYRQMMRMGGKNVKIQEDKEVKLNGSRGLHMKASTNQGGNQYVMLSIAVTDGKRVIVATGTSLKSNWHIYGAPIEESLYSLKLY